MTTKLAIYLETGSRRTFAAALDWPGWCRSGKNEKAALEALFEYGPRYARILRRSRLGFRAPDDISAFFVTERLKGNATTDFGAPDAAPSGDADPLADEELRRLESVLRACWRGFDAAVDLAKGKTLQTGPRGGGRKREGIVEHVLGAERGYLSSLGGKVGESESQEAVRQAILKTLKASARGEIAEFGPRGGKRWSPRYFVRRETWHVLDHLWEIEDRLKELDE